MSIIDLTKYKEIIISKITQSQDIKNIILSANGSEGLPNEPLLYSNIFPYLHTPGTQTDLKTYICVDCIVSKIINPSIKEIKVIINVFSHKDTIKYSDTDISKTKPDIISNMLDTLLNSSREFGIGKLSLESVDLYNLQNVYYGKILTYKCAEFTNK